MRLAPWLLAAPGLFLTAFFAYPLALVLREASAPAWAWLAGPYVRDRMLVAFQQALLSAALAMAAALALAWLYHARRVPGGRLQRAIHAAPFILPVFVVVYGMQQAFGPDGLTGRMGFDLLGAVGPLGAVVLANALYNYGFAARLLHTALESRPHRLEDAARLLGASPAAAAWRVSLPLLLPRIAAVALLVFLFCFASFGVVLFLGQGEVATLETLLYQSMAGIRPRPDRAAVLGLAQLAANVLLLAGFLAFLRRPVPAEAPRPRPLASPGLQAAAWLAAGLALVPPLLVLAGGFRLDGEWSLEPWRALLDAGHPAHVANFDLPIVLLRSLVYAAGSAIGAFALCLAFLYGGRVLRPGWRRPIEALASVPLGTSSLLIGLGLFLAFGPGSVLDLRASPWAILVAHTLVALPFVARILLPAMEAHDHRLDEAAATLGASPAAVAWRIHRPLLAGPLAAALGMAAALSLGDYGASLLLMRSDTAGLAVWIGRHDRPFDPLAHAQAVALAGLLVVLAAAAYALVERSPPKAKVEARP